MFAWQPEMALKKCRAPLTEVQIEERHAAKLAAQWEKLAVEASDGKPKVSVEGDEENSSRRGGRRPGMGACF